MLKHVAFVFLIITLISSCSKSSGLQTVEERQRLSAIHSQLSFQFMLNENIDVAEGEAKEALRLSPRGVQANHAMARVFQAIGDDPNTVLHYSQALKTDPNAVAVLNDYGHYLCKQGLFNQAMENFNHATGQLMHPQRMVSYTRAAACLIRHDAFNKAELYLLKALELNVRSSAILFNLARVSYFKKNIGAANNYLDQYFNVVKTPSNEAINLASKIRK